MSVGGTADWSKTFICPVPQMSPLQGWTLSAWVRLPAARTGWAVTVASSNYPAPNGSCINLGYYLGQPQCYSCQNNGVQYTARSPNAVSFNSWHSIVGVYPPGWWLNTSLIQIWVDGVLMASASGGTLGAAGNYTMAVLTTPSLSAGSSAEDLAEVSVWNAALSPGDVRRIAGGGCPSTVRPGWLLKYFPLVRDFRDLGSLRQAAWCNKAGYNPTWKDHPSVSGPPPRRMSGFTASASIAPGPATITLAANAPLVSSGSTLTPSPGGLLLSGGTPFVSADANVPPPAPGEDGLHGGLLLSGGTPLVSASASVAPGPAAITLAGSPVSLSAGSTLTPGAAGLLLAGGEPLVSADANLAPPAGSLLLSGAPVVLRIDFTIAPGAASILLAGSAPIVWTTGLAAVLVPSRRRVSATVDIRRVSATPDVRILPGNPDIRRISSPRDD